MGRGNLRPREGNLPTTVTTSRERKAGPGFSPRRWECRCALLGDTVLAGAGAEVGALMVLAGGSSLRWMLDSFLPQFPQHYLWLGTGDEAVGHTRACRDTVQLSLNSVGSSPSLMEAPFRALPPSPLKSGPVRASRRSIRKTLGDKCLLWNERLRLPRELSWSYNCAGARAANREGGRAGSRTVWIGSGAQRVLTNDLKE